MEEFKALFTNIPIILALASVRAGLTLTIVPFFGASGMPRQAMLITTLGVIIPMTLPTISSANITPLYGFALVLKEAFLGILMAFFISIAFWGVEIAGELIDLQRGTTAGGLYNPMLGAQESPMGSLFLRVISDVFFITGGFLTFFGVLFESYRVYPVGSMLPPFIIGWQHFVCPFITKIFQMGVLFAAPLLIIFFFMDFGLGLMNRFVSQLNVFFISLPIKSGLCFFFMLFYISYMIEGFNHDMFTGPGVANFLRGLFR